jgi:hypothetical protein
MYAPFPSHRTWEVKEAIPELDARPGCRVTLTQTGVWVFREHPIHARSLLISYANRLRPLVPGPGNPPPLVQTGLAGRHAESPDFGALGVRVLRQKRHLSLLA